MPVLHRRCRNPPKALLIEQDPCTAERDSNVSAVPNAVGDCLAELSEWHDESRSAVEAIPEFALMGLGELGIEISRKSRPTSRDSTVLFAS